MVGTIHKTTLYSKFILYILVLVIIVLEIQMLDQLDPVIQVISVQMAQHLGFSLAPQKGTMLSKDRLLPLLVLLERTKNLTEHSSAIHV